MTRTTTFLAAALALAIAGTSVGAAHAMTPRSTHWVTADVAEIETEFQVYDAKFKFKKFGGAKKKKSVAGGFGKKKFYKFKY